MLIGQVIGDVVATQKHTSHEQLKLLLVAPLSLADLAADNPSPDKEAQPFLAVDTVDAGVGDRVLLATDGWAAMSAVRRPRTPIDAAIIGVVDHVELVDDAV